VFAEIGLLFGSKLVFSRILGLLYCTFWWCSRVWLWLCRKWTHMDEIWCTTLLGAGPGRFSVRSVQ